MPTLIYIPIWLDLLYISPASAVNTCSIYIPIWLDLLSKNENKTDYNETNLHSNMVRFIILNRGRPHYHILIFTFQYG